METKDAISLVAASVALLSVASVAAFAWINYRREKLNQKIQHANLRQQYFLALRAWSDQLSDVLSEAIHFCELDPTKCPAGSFFERRNKFRITLSSMIDRGRWFFPNLHTKEYGQHKERAFRGYRQEVLNSLVESYRIITKLNYVDGSGNNVLKDNLVTAKKRFVSEVQNVLDPSQREKEFFDITKHVIGINGPKED